MQRHHAVLPLAAGVDRGTNPQLVGEALLTAQNVVFSREGLSSKRTGWKRLQATGSNYDQPLVGMRQGEPFLLGDYVHTKVSAAVASALGEHFAPPGEASTWYGGLLDAYPLHYVAGTGENPDFVDLGGSAALGFYVVALSYQASARVDLIDAETGALLATRQVVTGCSFVRLLTSADGHVWYLFIDPVAGTIRGAEVTIATGVPAAADVWTSTTAAAGEYQMDVCAVDGSDCAVAFLESGGDVQVFAFDAAAGTAGANTTYTPAAGAVHPIALCRRNATSFVLAALCENAGALHIEAQGLTLAMAIDFTLTAIALTHTRPYDIGAIATDEDTVEVFATTGRTLPLAASHVWQRRHIERVQLASSGGWAAGTPSVWLHHCRLAAKPFLDPYSPGKVGLVVSHLPAAGQDAATTYTGVEVRSQIGSTFIVRDHGTPAAVGKLALNQTYVCIEDASYAASDWSAWCNSTSWYNGRLGHVIDEGSERLSAPVPVLGQFDLHSTYHASPTPWIPNPRKFWEDRIAVSRGAGAYVARLDFSDVARSVVEGRDWALVPNSVPLEFDGVGVVEQGYLWYPEDVRVESAGAGTISGTFAFAVVAHWEDHAGNTHWSAPAFTKPMAFTNVVGFDVTIGALSLTRKPGVEFYVYRTADAGQAFYFIGKVANNPAVEAVTAGALAWTDSATSTLQGSGVYTEGAVLEDTQPPPYRVATMWRGRPVVAHREHESTLLLYGKQERERVGCGFNEVFALWCDPTGGDMTALAVVADRLIIFKADRIYATDGEGLNEQGQGAGFARPYLLRDGVGCVNRQSVVLTPQGVMFLAETGLMMLDASLQVTPIGEAVRDWTDGQTIVAALAIPDRDVAVFIPAAGEALVWNWRHARWSTWTGLAGASAAVDGSGDIWLREARTSDKVVTEDRASYLDWSTTPILPVWKSGWLSPAGLTAEMRLWGLRVLGYAQSAAELRVKCAYNHVPKWVDSQVKAIAPGEYFGPTAHYTSSVAADHSAMLLRTRGSRTRCTAVQLELSEENADYDSPAAQQLLASDRASGDGLGYACDLDAGTLVVGAPYDHVGANSDQGSAYVYVRNPNGSWTQQARLVASDGAANDYLGLSVAIEGDTILVGAYGHDTSGLTTAGAAYVFTRSGTTWTQAAKIVSPTPKTQENFGWSVGLDGGSAVIGAIGYGASNQGCAYVFTGAGATWTLQQQIVPTDPAANDQFGRFVAIDADTVIAGAPYADISARTDQGAAYVFVRSGSTWTQQQKLTASDGAAGDYFGWGVAIDGDTALAAAPRNDAQATNAGAAYVFVRSGSSWTQQQKLIPTQAAANDYAGGYYTTFMEAAAVALLGDTLAIGLPSNKGSGIYSGYYVGGVVLFTRSGTTWTQSAIHLQISTTADSAFGVGLALASSPRAFAVGAPRTAGGGAAYIYDASGAGLALTALALEFGTPGGLHEPGNTRSIP